jgi:CubicO group peptidase (beta-lactamase class C family)
MSMTNLNRRHVLAALGAGVIHARHAFAKASLQAIGERLTQAQHDGRVSGLHALLVSQGRTLVFEYYARGENESFAPDVLHDLRSVTKSLVVLVYGIALAAGKVPPPEAKLYDQFPEYADLGKQPGRERLTVQHALSMTLGLEWDELTISYGDPRNSDQAMEAAPDRFRFILERPIVDEPGVTWTYCGGATALLGRMIAKGTREELLAYARRVLFGPLDFGPAEWTKGHDGEPHSASGLRLVPRDMLKVGQLVLAGGAWNGSQIVPSDWMKRVTTPAAAIEPGYSYGYHWYLGESMAGTPPRSHHWVAGIGWGGQCLFVLPTLDLVLAINSGNHNKPFTEQRRIIRALLTEIVLPSFV